MMNLSTERSDFPAIRDWIVIEHAGDSKLLELRIFFLDTAYYLNKQLAKNQTNKLLQQTSIRYSYAYR